MKKILPAFFILFLCTYFSSCERDDICVDGDTPLLVLAFFDATDTTDKKAVNAIRIKALDNDSILNDSESFSFTDRGTTGAGAQDSILIPLRINGTSTSFTLISNSADTEEETGNIDTLTITYTTREAFISRGCGFVINFDNLNLEVTTDDENWIQDISVQQQTIENSENVHVKIFH